MQIKTKYIIALVAILVCGMLYYFWYLGSQTAAYDDIPDITSEYTIDTEMAAAQKALADGVEPAQVYTRNPAQKGLVITFDGLPEPAVAAKLTDLLETYQMDAAFFVEGSNASADKETMKTLQRDRVTLGNYTFAGIPRLDRLPQDSVLEQLVRTQKVLNVLTGTAPSVFKAPQTSYVVPLLTTAAAAGLKSAVKTDVYVNRDAITSDAAAEAFIASVPPGSIVSIVINTPAQLITYEPGKTDEKPAKDKQPNLQIPKINTPVHEDVTVVTERLFKAMKKQGIPSLKLKDARQIKRADTEPNAPAQPVAFLRDRLTRLCPTVQAAEPTPAVTDLTNTAAARQVTQTPPRMIQTTEPSVALAFAGLTKPAVVQQVLTYLRQNKAQGTFFVMENELKTNPQLVRDIVQSGNEVAIGLRSLKDSNYETTRRQIQYVQSQLQALGVTTNLVMQPWGQITDDTRRAVADMGCQMYAPTLSLVSSKHQHYTSADAVMQEQFGKFVYSVGRGWILYFRLDYYDDDTLVCQVLDLVKRHKIDNIAYHSFYDDPKINAANDSAYAIKSLGAILQNKGDLYTLDMQKDYPTDGQAYIQSQTIPFKEYMYQRYIGNKAVADDNMFGFSVEEKRYRDLSGLIHTDQPVVFFTFDDFGNDAAINHLLYVLRKHHALGTFFVLTKNVMKNPNIVRAIAKEGHDVGSHSEQHRPMDNTPYAAAYPQYLVDYGMAAAKLRDITQGIQHPDGTPGFVPYFRPPTLTASKAGFRALYDTGYTYIVSGSYSTHDYEQPDLQHMVRAIQSGIYDAQGHVIKGAILVMHMSDQSLYTPIALDMLLTINDQRPDGDPAKFIPLPLSAYLADGYSQGAGAGTQTVQTPGRADAAGTEQLYAGSGY